MHIKKWPLNIPESNRYDLTAFCVNRYIRVACGLSHPQWFCVSYDAHSRDPYTSVSCLSEVTAGICNQAEVVPKEPDLLGSERKLNFPS